MLFWIIHYLDVFLDQILVDNFHIVGPKKYDLAYDVLVFTIINFFSKNKRLVLKAISFY